MNGLRRKISVAGISFVYTFCLIVAPRAGRGQMPEQSSPSRTAENASAGTPLQRGRYLVESVAHCFGCHSEMDYPRLAGQPIRGREGAGQILPAVESGLSEPFRIVCPNITPDRETGAGTWTDEQFARALRQGIGHDGRILSDRMPYWNFQSLTGADLAAVIAYIRSIPPVKGTLLKMNLPDKIEVNMHPELTPPLPPNASEQVRHGWYLVRLGNCATCHTPRDKQNHPLPNLLFAGGRHLVGGWGDVFSSNITPAPSGISHYDEAMFLKTIRTENASGGVRALNPVMPLSYYRNMTDEDLKAIFAYLQTFPPLRHVVDNTEPPTYCKVCRQTHGYGDKN